MYSAFVNENSVSPLAATVPAFFAKSSLLWPSILNLMAHKKAARKIILKILPKSLKFLIKKNKITPIKSNSEALNLQARYD